MNLPPLLRWLLWPLSLVYREATRFRWRLYSNGVLKRKRLKTPVISVGNLTVGGTGKTPMVIWLAQRFLSQGKRVGILSRGYKGAAGTSDEIELMKFRLQDRAMFGVGPDRFEQGRRLEEQGVDILLLDDGYQHLQLARDVNILLLDAARPLGNEAVLPSGTLREPISAMDRADLLVFTRTETTPGTDGAIAKLENYPVFSASTRLLGFRRLAMKNEMLDVSAIGAGPFYAFCGIGNPNAYFLDLKNWNVPVIKTCEFPDHHRYDQRDVRELVQVAQAAGAKAFVTTEKDAQNLVGVGFGDMPLYVAVIELMIAKEEAFWAEIGARLEARNRVV
jgi:tetraacyldisaccharide 4'-kinase